ncbi:MAG: hypothetical protein AMXMBFR58_30230 [Phycisphaerae bacterium]
MNHSMAASTAADFSLVLSTLGQATGARGAAAAVPGAADMLPAFVAIVAVLSLLPFLMTMLTSFAKLVVVGGIVRQAVGTPQIPPTIVVTGLALILTVHIMAPVAITIARDFEAVTVIQRASSAGASTVGAQWERLSASMIAQAADAGGADAAVLSRLRTVEQLLTDTSSSARVARARLASEAEVAALGSAPKTAAGDGRPAFDAIATDENLLALRTAVEGPIEEFLRRHASKRNIELFDSLIGRLMAAQKIEGPQMPTALRKFVTLAPAFVLTELSEAFMIGFLIFVPFLVVDLVVSNILLALGMQMLTPTMISLPLKLLVFVVMDGWGLILRGLVAGYA